MTTLVQAVKNTGNDQINSLTLTAGDGLIIAYANSSGLADDHITTITDSQSNTWVQAPGSRAVNNGPGTREYTEIWYCLSAASTGSCNITIHTTNGSSTSNAYFYEISGALEFGDADSLVASGTIGNEAVITSPTLTASTSSIFVACASQVNLFLVPTIGSPWVQGTEDIDNDAGPTAYAIDSGSLSASFDFGDTWSGTTTTTYTVSIAVFNAAPTTGNIIVSKVTDPPGSSQSFVFTPNYEAGFSLIDGQSNDSGPLTPGTYSVSEAPVSGWTTTTSQDPTSIVVGAGDTVTLTFTNTQHPPPPECGKQTLLGGRFQTWDGKVITNGYLSLELSEDAKESCFGGTIVAGLPVRLQLDMLGSVTGRPSIWANDTLFPADTYYVVTAFTKGGRRAWRLPQFWFIPSTPSPFDVGTLTALNPEVLCCPPVSPGGNVLLLQTNGVNNGSQSKLNLINGTGIVITDNGFGGVTIAATGGGGGGNASLIIVNVAVTGSVAYASNPWVLELDTAGVGGITRTLPTAVGNAGSVFTLKKVDSAIGIITINTTGGQTIDGFSSVLLTNLNQYVTMVTDGNNWQIAANN